VLTVNGYCAGVRIDGLANVAPRNSRVEAHAMIENDGRVTVIGDLRARFDEAREAYAVAAPFPHVVLDNVLPADVFANAIAEFPSIDDPSWKGYLHVNETKFANPVSDTWGSTLQAIADAFCSDDFVKWLSGLTGFEHLIADPSMDGGGLHHTLQGGHLNVHADFTTHHRHRTWRRRINILLYLNESWSPDWGGALELWDSDVRTCIKRVEPLANRMLIFTTSGDAYHGHPDPLQCPEGVSRRSLALYYFTVEERPSRRSTKYRPRPGDGAKGVAIWIDRRMLSLYDTAKTRLKLSDQFASRTLGFAHRLTARVRNRRH